MLHALHFKIITQLEFFVAQLIRIPKLLRQPNRCIGLQGVVIDKSLFAECIVRAAISDANLR